MINRNNKKGFTIVELVIVIAVIAILAAVLIPTFSGIVKKAQLSSDQQAVRNMNIALAASGDLGDDMNKVIDALSENGFNSKKALIPVSKDFQFMYSKANDCIVLVNEKNEVVYPEDITYDVNDVVSLENSVKYLDVVAKDVESFAQALLAGSEDIKLENDLEYSGEQLTIPTGTTLTLDLNGKNFDASSQASRPFRMTSNSALVINAEGSTIESGAYGLVEIPAGVQNVSVTINGGTVTGTMDDGAFIKVRNGNGNINITLNGVSMIDGTNAAPSDSWLLSIENDFEGTINLNITGGVFEAKVGFQCFKGTYTVSGAKITTAAFAFEVGGDAKATIDNCTITTGTVSSSLPATAVAVSYGGEATVTNCTITSEVNAFAVLNTGGSIKYKNNNIIKGAVDIMDSTNGTYDEIQ